MQNYLYCTQKMTFIHQYVLSLGSNLNNRQKSIQQAIQYIQEDKIYLKRISQLIETPPYMEHTQDSFLNQSILVETSYPPTKLLKIIQNVERQLHRKKRFRYGPREIDIDIIWWSQGSFLSHNLVIPHPYLMGRYWVRNSLIDLISDKTDFILDLSPISMQSSAIHSPLDFIAKKKKQEKITMTTCYDYTMAKLLSRTSLDAILIGDSLGNVIKGEATTIQVRLEEIIYHTKAVRKGLKDTFIIADMPFLTCKLSTEQSIRKAGRVIQETQCDAVKIEGGKEDAQTVKALVQVGIPVMGHIGLQVQHILHTRRYFVQGKNTEQQETILQDALALEQAGCFAIVLEAIPETLGRTITQSLQIPTIGIGAGQYVDGQILVINDLLGMDPDFQPKYVRRYVNLSDQITQSIEHYCKDIRENSFPNDKESYS